MPTLKKTITALGQHFIEQHKKGLAALHITRCPREFYEKLDDPRIIGNLREDGGTEHHDFGYQLYTSVSTTLLPPSEYRISQKLFSRAFAFVGLDVEPSLIRDFSPGDADTSYHCKNKHGRPSYKVTTTMFGTDFSLMPRAQHLPAVIECNFSSARKVPKLDKSTSGRRGMNELVLKVNLSSMCCLGIIIEGVLEFPT